MKWPTTIANVMLSIDTIPLKNEASNQGEGKTCRQLTHAPRQFTCAPRATQRNFVSRRPGHGQLCKYKVTMQLIRFQGEGFSPRRARSTKQCAL